jgi:ATP-dependent DNA helicase RecG
MKKEELIKKLEDIEWEDFEVKEAKSEIPKSSWQTVSAFSNTAGGWLIFGVSKKGRSYIITGISNPEKIEQDFTTTLRSGKFNKKIKPACKKYLFNGKIVLAFYISQQAAKDKPVYYGSTNKNTFIRTGSGDQRGTIEEIDSFYRQASFEEKDKDLSSYNIGDLNEETLRKYRNMFSQVNPGHRYNPLDNKTFLEKLRVVKNDKITFGGLLVFGSEDILADEIPNYGIDYIEINGTSYEDAPMRYNYRLLSERNLLLTFFDIYERLLRKIEIPFTVKRGVRDEDPPHLQAIREALVNMIIHSDYFSPAFPRIRVFTDRIEFFNPGALPKKLDIILKEDFSMPRNPIIAKIFRFVKLAEDMGTGFHRMINGWFEFYNIKPKITGDFDYYKITFPTIQKPVEKTTVLLVC